jgi:hypothetical protein
MLTIKTADDLKKYTNNNGDIHFPESVRVEINLSSRGTISSDGDISSHGKITELCSMCVINSPRHIRES